jgi:hypothetical protein
VRGDAAHHQYLLCQLQRSLRSPVEDCIARVDRHEFSREFALEDTPFALLRDVSGI